MDTCLAIPALGLGLKNNLSTFHQNFVGSLFFLVRGWNSLFQDKVSASGKIWPGLACRHLKVTEKANSEVEEEHAVVCILGVLFLGVGEVLSCFTVISLSPLKWWWKAQGPRGQDSIYWGLVLKIPPNIPIPGRKSWKLGCARSACGHVCRARTLLGLSLQSGGGF